MHRDGALGEFATAFTSAPISIGRAEAQRQGLAYGKIERTESEGGLIYPCRHMIQFVERLDATYNANLTLEHEEYYGSAVLMKVHELIASNDDAFLGFLASSVLPLINKSSFPRDVYAFMIDGADGIFVLRGYITDAALLHRPLGLRVALCPAVARPPHARLKIAARSAAP